MDKFREPEQFDAAVEIHGGEPFAVWAPAINGSHVKAEIYFALLAELEAKDKRIANLEFEQGGYGYSVIEDLNGKIKRIAELEADELALIDERDSAEDVIAEMYEAATGNRPQWSSCFRFSDAVEGVAQVRARMATPVRLVAYRNSPDMHTKQYYEAIGFNQGIDACSVALRAAGFTVEGDE